MYSPSKFFLKMAYTIIGLVYIVEMPKLFICSMRVSTCQYSHVISEFVPLYFWSYNYTKGVLTQSELMT